MVFGASVAEFFSTYETLTPGCRLRRYFSVCFDFSVPQTSHPRMSAPAVFPSPREAVDGSRSRKRHVPMAVDGSTVGKRGMMVGLFANSHNKVAFAPPVVPGRRPRAPQKLQIEKQIYAITKISAFFDFLGKNAEF